MVRVGQGFWELLAIILAGLLAISFVFNVYFASFRFTSETYIPFGFSFEWGPESQNIVNGTFRLGVKMWIDGDNVTMVIDANDNEYDTYDYVGLVFDTNQNGHIDQGDDPYGLYACNRTVASVLCEHGFLGFTQGMEVRGPQNVSFNARTGYTFNIEFPSYYPTKLEEPWYDPARAIKNGTNPLHICFYDYNATFSISPNAIQGVFSRFTFYVGT
jgi:hypothetical protein